MDEIDVDAVRTEAAQTGLERRPQVAAGRTLVIRPGPGGEIKLAGNDNVVAAIPDQATQDFLGPPPA